ncbi:MAG: hypothetical protein N2C14_00875 [Planctomycetales bacterium]
MVVFTEEGCGVGLVVDRVIDVVEGSVELQKTAPEEGILGSAVIHEAVTDLLDVAWIIQNAGITLDDHPIPLADHSLSSEMRI